MERYTSQQQVEIIKIYYRNSESVTSTLRAPRPIYSRKNRASSSTFERPVEKVESRGTVQDVPVPVRQRSALRLQLKKAQMCRSHFVLKHWASLLYHCVEFCEMILSYILTKSNLCMNWSRLTTRSVVCSWNWVEQQLVNDSDFYRKIIFSDEAYFWLNGFIYWFDYGSYGSYRILWTAENNFW